MNLKVVAGLSRMGGPEDCSFVTFEVRKDLYESGEISSVADWKGRKVGLNGIGAMPQYQLAALLEAEGMTLDDVELVVLPFPELVVGLQSKAIDVIIAAEPLQSQIKAQDIGVTQLKLNDIFPYQTFVFLMYGPNLLDKNPDLGERFMVAYLKGIRASMERQTEENVGYVSKLTKLPAEVLNAACWDDRDPNAAIQLDTLMEVQEWFLSANMQDDRVSETDLFDSRFIDHAVDVLGEVSQ
jgi:NitT/TauT family transport system substrate-binding protein